MRKMCWMETAKRIRSGGASSTSYSRFEGRLRGLSSTSSLTPGATHVNRRWRTEDRNEFARPSVAIESILSRHVGRKREVHQGVRPRRDSIRDRLLLRCEKMGGRSIRLRVEAALSDCPRQESAKSR